MAKKYLAALIISAAALSGIWYKSTPTTAQLSRQPTAGIEEMIQNRHFTAGQLPATNYYPASAKLRAKIRELSADNRQLRPSNSPQKDESGLLSKYRTAKNLEEIFPKTVAKEIVTEEDSKNYWSPLFQQSGAYIPNREDGKSPEFEIDCTSQCIYLEVVDNLEEPKEPGYIRYEVNSGEQLSLRVSRHYHQLLECDEDNETCDTAQFTLDSTYLVIDSSGNLEDFGITGYNYSELNLGHYVSRILDAEGPWLVP
ncbi:MAG TPA: hypothetical protein VJH68_02010 [Candidatus Nanoarchaeia archaeon]|nr:hypothetical protein [Candidatus Nanoarchaeia archaeon]